MNSKISPKLKELIDKIPLFKTIKAKETIIFPVKPINPIEPIDPTDPIPVPKPIKPKEYDK